MPKFLELLSEKILLTGKYLNAIYETGKIIVRKEKESSQNSVELTSETDVNSKAQTSVHQSKIIVPNAVEIVFTIKEEVYKQIVENAYNYSSKVLLDLLLNDHKLINRLRYFMLLFC